MKCLEKNIERKAARENVSAAEIVARSIGHCARGGSRWAGVDLAAAARGRGCPADPRTWMALLVRQQAREVPYWLLWHMALGVSHFIVYDNDDRRLALDARDAKTLRKVPDRA